MILEDKLLVLTPDNSSKTAQWACTSNLPSELMPKVCTFDDGVGGIADGTAWEEVPGDEKKNFTACWDEVRAESYPIGGWVTGPNSASAESQGAVRDCASASPMPKIGWGGFGGSSCADSWDEWSSMFCGGD